MTKNKLLLLLALLMTAATGAWAQRLYLEVDGTAATLKYSANEADYSGKPSFTGTTWQNASGFKAYVKTITVDASCENFAGDKLQGLFTACSVLTSVTGLGTINTTNVTTMQQMFNNCSKLETVDLSGFNTANVTTMQQMFYGCSALETVDLSGFNTANVTDMKNMFYNCSSLETVDLSSFNTSSVTNMSYMFMACTGLKSVNFSGLNTSSVTNMSYMFNGCSKLETVDLSGFNTANVTDMKNMFQGCTGLKSVNFSGLNTSGVTTMTYMFQGCTGLQTLDLSDLNTSSVTDMRNMFQNCTGLQTLDISSFNTGNVTKMGSMFNGCSQLTAIFVGDDWSVASSANSMFTDCTNLPNWDGTSDGTKAYYGGDGKGYLTYKVDGPAGDTKYTVSMKDGVKDADKWTVKVGDGQAQALPIGGLKGDGTETVTLQYNGRLKVKGVKATSDAAPAAPAYPMASEATAADYGKVVCAAGHLHDAKTAVPDGCTAVGILGKVTETGHGLILALQNATSQNWNTINGWTSETTYAGTTLKVLPDAARGSLTSYTTLGETTVSNWAVAQKSDYVAIFTNLGSTTGDSNGNTYDANVNAYITTGVGGTAISGDCWSATESSGSSAWFSYGRYWNYSGKTDRLSVRPVLGF